MRRLYASSTEFRSILINSGFKNCFGLHLHKNRKTNKKSFKHIHENSDFSEGLKGIFQKSFKSSG